MGWFSRKHKGTPPAEGAAGAGAGGEEEARPQQHGDEAHARPTKEQRKQAKAAAKAVAKARKDAEKQRKREAAQTLKDMKTRARAVRKHNAQVEKDAKRHARLVHRMQRTAEKRRRRAIRKCKKDAKRRHKRRAKAERAERRRQQQRERDQPASPQLVTAGGGGGDAVAGGADAAPVMAAPVFKKRKCCASCALTFRRLATRPRHHCRNCGDSFCGSCLSERKHAIPWFKLPKPQKVCRACDASVFSGAGGLPRNDAPATTGAVSNTTTTTTAASHPINPTRVRARTEEATVIESAEPALRRTASMNELLEPTRSAASRRGGGLRVQLRARSRRDTNSGSQPRKNSLWTLPIRPLLKRKESAEQLRNRAWDLDLQVEKAEVLARQRRSQMVLLTEQQPQFALAS